MAEDIGCSQQMVSLYLRGETKPGRTYALAIARVYRIPVAWWSEPAASVPSQTETPRTDAQAERLSRGGRKRGQGVSVSAEVMP